MVSIWQQAEPTQPSGQDRAIAPEDKKLRGLVWEADPNDPGRFAQPESFSTLDALPQILDALLDAATDGSEDKEDG